MDERQPQAPPPPPPPPPPAPPSEAPPPMLPLLRSLGRVLGLLPRPLAAAASFGWMALIWWLSSGPIDVAPPLPASDFFWNLAHAPVFGVLAALVALAAAPRPLPRSWPDPGRRARLVALVLVAAWAAADEWHQWRVPGRHGSPLDFLTDVAGAACVLWIAAYAGRQRADEGGLRRRIAIGVGLCAAAALAATLVDRGA
jgi:VanZ family protein